MYLLLCEVNPHVLMNSLSGVQVLEIPCTHS